MRSMVEGYQRLKQTCASCTPPSRFARHLPATGRIKPHLTFPNRPCHPTSVRALIDAGIRPC